MNIRIENGITIISTGKRTGERVNKHGQHGVSMEVIKGETFYKAEMQVNNVKYYLGRYETVEEAIAIRKEADIHVMDGTIHEWIIEQKKEYRESVLRKIRNKVHDRYDALECKHGEPVPLAYWARKNNANYELERRKVNEGRYKSAFKERGKWYIACDEVPIYFKGEKKGGF